MNAKLMQINKVDRSRRFRRGQEASMPDMKTHSGVGVFLSYVHEDNDILQAVHRAFGVIRQQTQQQLEIFYDKKSIDGGDIFDDIRFGTDYESRII
jgi:hypothetical protein